MKYSILKNLNNNLIANGKKVKLPSNYTNYNVASHLDSALNFIFKLSLAIDNPEKNQRLLDSNSGGVRYSQTLSDYLFDLKFTYTGMTFLLNVNGFKYPDWMKTDLQIISILENYHQNLKPNVNFNYSVPVMNKNEHKQFSIIVEHLKELRIMINQIEV